MNKKIFVLSYSLLLGIFLPVIVTSPASSATSYYVSFSIGHDDFEGTEPELVYEDPQHPDVPTNGPWKTIFRVNCQKFPPAYIFNPGDTIHFKRGDTWTGEQLEVNFSGSEGNPITFTAYGEGEQPTFDVNGQNDPTDPNRHGINITEKNYIVISNIKIKNFGVSCLPCSASNGIHINKSNHIKVDHCTITGETNHSHGINIQSTSNDVFVGEENDISHCEIGVRVKGTINAHPSKVIISNNTIHDMDKGTLSGADGVFFDPDTERIPINYTDTIIEFNHIYNCADQHIDLVFTQNVEVRYNLCHGNVAAGGDGNAIKLSLDIIDESPPKISTGLNVHNNIFYNTQNCGVVGLSFEGDFFNNIVFNTGKENIFLSAPYQNNSVNIFNNIFMNPGSGFACLRYFPNAINTLDYNCYWRDDGDKKLINVNGIGYTLSQWETYKTYFAPLDKHSIAQDPLFVDPDGPDNILGNDDDDFHLQSSSLCIDAGDPSSSYDNELQPNGCRINMGAYGNTTEATISSDPDSDGIYGACDNCPNHANGPALGTCICGGNSCMSDNDCEYGGSCSMNQEDTNNDGVGDVCAPSLCRAYLCRYECCIELDNTGRNLDYTACQLQNNQASCEAAYCFWDTKKNKCYTDICFGDVNFDGKVSAWDYGVERWEYGRTDCACNLSGELCQSYSDLFNCCIELDNTGRNLDYTACQLQNNQASCEAAYCFWDTKKNKCYTDICFGDVNFDGKVSAWDYGVERWEYGRTDCACNP
jgi:hypothetical protein